tara:strand:+ start:2852 stop:3550 length:699 start_codon:yes stop_codon:yes gene_type:complete
MNNNLESSFSIDLEKGFTISVWSEQEVCNLLEIEEDYLKRMIVRTGKQCKNIGWKLSYNINFINQGGSFIITTVGFYQLVKLNEQFKEYVPYFSELAINDLIRYQGFKQKKSKSKKEVSELEKEFKSQYVESPEYFESKVIDSELKTPNFDIEDKSHLFYRKSVVITGTFEKYPKRDKMAELIKSVGGNNNGSISRKTDFVIVGDNAGPKKLEKIEEYGIKVFNECEFIDLF